MALRPPKLVDLSMFGIHIMNPEQQCCRCKANMRGFSDGIFADELCGNCYQIPVRKTDGSKGHGSRRELQFYRPRTVWVMHPSTYVSQMRTIWSDVLIPNRPHHYFRAVVRIDGKLYVARDKGGYVSLHTPQGQLVRDFGLRLDQKHMGHIYEAQQRTA